MREEELDSVKAELSKETYENIKLNKEMKVDNDKMKRIEK